jgi:hypothetical protein
MAAFCVTGYGGIVRLPHLTKSHLPGPPNFGCSAHRTAAYNPVLWAARLSVRRMSAIQLTSLIPLPFLAASGPSVEDRPIVRILQRAEPSLKQVFILKRRSVSDQLNLVVAISRPGGGDDVPSEGFGWSDSVRLGLFLQDRTNPSRVYQLAIKPGLGEDCFARIEQITGRELVLSARGEKGAIYDSQKFIFDVRTKALVHFSYPPFQVSQVLQSPQGPQFVMSDTQQLLLVETGADNADLRVVPNEQAHPTLSRIRMKESSVRGGRVYRRPVPLRDPPAFGVRKRFRLAKEPNKDGFESLIVTEKTGSKESKLLRGDEIQSYFVDRTVDGRYEIVERTVR